MKININSIEDDIGGKWWNYISASNFGFCEKISNLDDYLVENDDILIHKQIISGDRFPTIRYHKVTEDGASVEIKNAKVKEVLQKRLIAYVKENKKFPYACELVKLFKNGNVQVNFTPMQYYKFVLKIIPAEHNIDDLESFFKGLETDPNPIQSSSSKKQTSAKQWIIESSSDKTKKYTVSLRGSGSWTCTCPQYVYRKSECKHIKQCKGKQ